MDSFTHELQAKLDRIRRSEEDYPDKNKEARVDLITRELKAFVFRVSDEYTETNEEDRVVRFTLGMDLLQSFLGDEHANLLRARLASRFIPKIIA